MARLVFVDGRGGALAAMAAALAKRAGVAFDEIVADTTTDRASLSVVIEALAEIGAGDPLPPVNVGQPSTGDMIVSVGTSGDGGWDVELARDDQPGLVQRALARQARDRLIERIKGLPKR